MSCFKKRFIAIAMFSSILLYFFYPHSYRAQNISLGATAPSLTHIMGTDIFGRDLFARVMLASTISITLGILTTFFAVTFGTIYGMISGFCGKYIDLLMMRLVDILYPIPLTLIVILLMVMFGKNIYVLFIAISAIEWMNTAKIVRAEVIKIREYGFVQTAKCLGQSSWKIIFKHIFPNIRNIIIVCFVITLPGIILLESFLSFLGIGIQPPKSSLGILISEGAAHIDSYPWEIIFPAASLVFIIYTLTIFGERLKKYAKM